MSVYRSVLATILVGGAFSLTCLGSTVFEDEFANGVVTNSSSVTGYWATAVANAAGDANAITEASGVLTMTAGSNDGGNDGGYSGVSLVSSVSSNYNPFVKIRTFRVRGITFDDHGSGITDSQEQMRFALLSDGNNSWAADDALVVKTTPEGKIRLGQKQNQPSNNSDGTLVYEFSGLGSYGTYGFDLELGPINGTSPDYQLTVYTGAVPVSVGTNSGSLAVTKANWAGSGDARMCLWTQEGNVNGGNQYFDATVSNLVVEVDENILDNAIAIDVGDGVWDDGGEDNANGLQIETNASTYFGSIGTGGGEKTVTLNGVTFTHNPGGTEYVHAWADYSCLIDPPNYTAPIPWKFEGLTPGRFYNLIFLAGASSQPAKVTITGVGTATSDADGDANFEEVEATGLGVIEGTWDVWSSGVWATFTAVQLELMPPPPGTLFVFE